MAAQAPFEVIFVLGGPGSGKGTQCERLVKKYGFQHLSAGDLLREERNSGSELADMINTYIKEGKIVPAEVTVGLLKKAMEASGKQKFLIDGFPRSVDNIEKWFEIMDAHVVLSMVLFFDCPEEVMEQRLLERGKTSGRNDDNIETIKKRFRTFQQESMPVVRLLEVVGKVKHILATPPPEEIFAEVQGYIEEAPLPDRTLAIIKPDAVGKGDVEAIEQAVKKDGFQILGEVQRSLSRDEVEAFYAEHKGKEFFDRLCTYMTSGPVVAMALEKPNGVKAWRALMGPTNVFKAKEEAPTSLRARFGTDGTQNATHGSDSLLSASRELRFFFPNGWCDGDPKKPMPPAAGQERKRATGVPNEGETGGAKAQKTATTD